MRTGIFALVSALERYEVRMATPADYQAAHDLENALWDTFHAKAHGNVWCPYWEELHVVAIDREDGRLVGTGDAVPFDWDGTIEGLPERGWQEVIFLGRKRKENPDRFSPARYASAVGISIDRSARRGGLGSRLLKAMKEAALAAGYEALAAPVRPSERWRMVDLPIDQYANVRLPGGRHFDPWVRAHESVGGEIISTCVTSNVLHGSREEWESWTGLSLPDDGRVLLDGANTYLSLESGYGQLIEDSIWLLHRP